MRLGRAQETLGRGDATYRLFLNAALWPALEILIQPIRKFTAQ
jgi:hypothetical protein